MQESLLGLWLKPKPTPQISGLNCLDELLSPSDEMALIHAIDQDKWQPPYQRRVQHYGSSYHDSNPAPFPAFVQVIAERLHRHRHFAAVPHMAIINEYLPGQGIGPHIDDSNSGEHIAILSLGSDICMEFRNDGDRHSLVLQRRSLCLLSGPARWQWQHGIPKRRTDIIHGVRQQRSRRISLTFRIANSLPAKLPAY